VILLEHKLMESGLQLIVGHHEYVFLYGSTAENISSEIVEILDHWKIKSKTCGLVGDNTAVMPKTGSLIQEEGGEMAEFEFWGCVAHLLRYSDSTMS